MICSALHWVNPNEINENNNNGDMQFNENIFLKSTYNTYVVWQSSKHLPNIRNIYWSDFQKNT